MVFDLLLARRCENLMFEVWPSAFEEFRAYEGLIGAMARALFTVGRTSQTESQIALMEWLRLEAQFARAEVVDEARIQSGSSAVI